MSLQQSLLNPSPGLDMTTIPQSQPGTHVLPSQETGLRWKNPYRGMQPPISVQFCIMFVLLISMMTVFFTSSGTGWTLKAGKIAFPVMMIVLLSVFLGLSPLRKQFVKELKRAFKKLRCRD